MSDEVVRISGGADAATAAAIAAVIRRVRESEEVADPVASSEPSAWVKGSQGQIPFPRHEK